MAQEVGAAVAELTGGEVGVTETTGWVAPAVGVNVALAAVAVAVAVGLVMPVAVAADVRVGLGWVVLVLVLVLMLVALGVAVDVCDGVLDGTFVLVGVAIVGVFVAQGPPS